MSFRLKPTAIVFMVMMAMLGFANNAGAAGVVGVLPFPDTGGDVPSHYAEGYAPKAELLQASDGNFYGTTIYGGSGLCPVNALGGYIGCGTLFQINAKTGVETVLYNFPFDTATSTAPDGAYPVAGLIQGKDGALYGVAADGGRRGCGGVYGCGTIFRISTTGAFTLLHQFCGFTGCPRGNEGGHPASHLVQTADGTFYGANSEGGAFNAGTLFSASASGGVTTLHQFLDGAGDGGNPYGALLVGHDGNTLYGTTNDGGAFDGGTVFSYGINGLTIIHSFDGVTSTQPLGALIYGADGLLYGTTSTGNRGATLYSLNTAGGGFAVDASFYNAQTATGLLLGSDGMMYGTLLGGIGNNDGSLFAYNPATQPLLMFGTSTGANPFGALIEGKDHYLYGTNSALGGSDSFGPDEGTLYRVGPPLSP